MVGSLQKPISAMARLENGMVSLKSVMLDANGEVKESFNGLSEAVIKTANKLPATAEEMYQAAAGAIARGMDAEALAKGGLEDSAKFAVGVLGNDYNRALEIAQLVSNAWGVGSDKLAGSFDHEQLAGLLKKSKARWILSYNDCPEICELYKNFQQKTFSRRCSLNNRNAKDFGELLVWNFDEKIQETLF